MPRKAYTGSRRKLLLAFDVGTTFSGISYSIMDPGQVPEIRPVTRYPGQGHVGADCKIPTEIYYDADGNVQAVGAEARRSGIQDIAEDEGWTKAKWFKLHMRPRGQRSNMLSPTIPPLPPNKAVVEVFSDFLRYLHKCARLYIQETHANGTSLWNSISGKISYVLTHPNGWEGPQQAQMREAAIRAGLISDNVEGRSRVSFVPEGEASLHFCINNQLAPNALEKGEGIVIVDAGGGTIDVSSYKGRGDAFQETSIPQCHFQGSVFVTGRAKEHVSSLLKDTDFEDYAPYIVDQFDISAKLMFDDASLPQFIHFGRPKEVDISLGIRNGQLKLTGATLASFFEPSVSCIVQAVKEQVASGHHPISHVFLVGGFSASDWLYQEVKKALVPEGLEVSRPDSHVNKAVSDGAAAFMIDHYVQARVSREYFGLKAKVAYDKSNPNHRQRQGKVVTHGVTQMPMLEGYFSIILSKNEKVSEAREYRQVYHRSFKSLDEMRSQPMLREDVIRYSGSSNNPEWIDDDPENFSTACTIQACTRHIRGDKYFSALGQVYYAFEYDIVLLFGLTELKAEIAWRESGVERRGPAEVIYEPN